jgi:hypothetical protein
MGLTICASKQLAANVCQQLLDQAPPFVFIPIKKTLHVNLRQPDRCYGIPDRLAQLRLWRGCFHEAVRLADGESFINTCAAALKHTLDDATMLIAFPISTPR